MSSALAQIILLICPFCLFIQFPYFSVLVDDVVSNDGQQLVFQMDDNLFSRCHSGVTSRKVQDSDYVLICRYYQRQRQGRSFWGINSCMRLPEEF